MDTTLKNELIVLAIQATENANQGMQQKDYVRCIKHAYLAVYYFCRIIILQKGKNINGSVKVWIELVSEPELYPPACLVAFEYTEIVCQMVGRGKVKVNLKVPACLVLNKLQELMKNEQIKIF